MKTNAYDFVLYPNPAEDYVIIESKSIVNEKIEVQIFDNSGKLIKKQSVNPSSQEKINISKLTSEIYWVNVYKKGELILSKKMIKK